MTDMFGHTWVSQYGADPAGSAADTWSAALASLSPQELATGLQAALMLGNDFPPSTPRFRALCMSIPTFAAVDYELRTNKGARSPFLRQTMGYLDYYLFTRADTRKAEKMLKAAYDMAVEYVMRGGTLPYPIEGELAAPTSQPRKPASPETAEAELRKMAELLREPEQENGSEDGDELCPAHTDEREGI